MPLQSSSLSPIAHPISIVVSVDKQKYYILLGPKQAKSSFVYTISAPFDATSFTTRGRN